ncbi:MAG: 2-C-methyl-D-erythritol 4-phosphate cytidylyltransferase [bacterium]|nr:2-C-methyl-D-erythritol 4-phosphate cytidylyltransferase [bacterium]MDE0287523.1 2-C-methyl-D-erythritol 4-phosphate cytidylyltransferase [bacterium]MDE0437750.1 2-C-methyl-D-erythritol 4-phosphate cytidylyltransferase [bacterium]
MTGREQVWGVVVAAGSGSRFGGPKHEVRLDGRALWEWARDALLESGVHRVVVVGRVPGGVEGGPARHVSVARGLAAVGEEATVIAVHDAARPLAPAAMMVRMYETLREGPWDGVIPVVPFPDSIKRVRTDDGRVVATLSRGEVLGAQTPQVFRAPVLRRAHAAPVTAGSVGPAPDDAAMVEAIGGRVVSVAGDRAAMKITYPEDLVVARALLRRRAGRGR